MDWNYKHFRQAAIFSATPLSLLEAARPVLAESLGGLEDTSDGFVARGRSAGHEMTATFHVAPATDGTQLAVELLVRRAAGRGYMLFDVGGYFDGQIDQWFSAIAQRLGGDHAQVLLSKTTSGVRTRRGCLAGCLVWFIAAACLGTAAFALDRVFFPQSSGATPGPFSLFASLLALLAGVAAFLYVTNPDGSVSKFIREQLRGTQNKEQS